MYLCFLFLSFSSFDFCCLLLNRCFSILALLTSLSRLSLYNILKLHWKFDYLPLKILSQLTEIPLDPIQEDFKAWDENYFYSTKVSSQEDSNIFGLSRWPHEKVPMIFHDALGRQFYFRFFTARDLLPGVKRAHSATKKKKHPPRESVENKARSGKVFLIWVLSHHQQHILTRCWRGSLIFNGHSRKGRKRSKLYEVIH